MHELFPKCTFKHLYGIASSLHKPKTPLFPKNCILYLTKRTFCICFLQNGLFGLEKLKQTGTYILANIKFYSPTQKSLSLIISSSSSSFFSFFHFVLKNIWVILQLQTILQYFYKLLLWPTTNINFSFINSHSPH